jgi:hypothetical protein
MIETLFFLYTYGVRYFRGGWYRCWAPVTILAFLVDVFANYTSLCMLGGWPKKGEYTFTSKLFRMMQESGLDQELYVQLALKLNRISFPVVHIKFPTP